MQVPEAFMRVHINDHKQSGCNAEAGEGEALVGRDLPHHQPKEGPLHSNDSHQALP